MGQRKLGPIPGDRVKDVITGREGTCQWITEDTVAFLTDDGALLYYDLAFKGGLVWKATAPTT